MPILPQYIDPYVGLAASVVTSDTVDTRDAFNLTLSWRTSSGTSSILSYQVSNSSLGPASVPEASWSHYTIFGLTGLGATSATFAPPTGYRWARVVRTVSNASYVVEINKLVR